jgi:hypothetical protein
MVKIMLTADLNTNPQVIVKSNTVELFPNQEDNITKPISALYSLNDICNLINFPNKHIDRAVKMIAETERYMISIFNEQANRNYEHYYVTKLGAIQLLTKKDIPIDIFDTAISRESTIQTDLQFQKFQEFVSNEFTIQNKKIEQLIANVSELISNISNIKFKQTSQFNWMTDFDSLTMREFLDNVNQNTLNISAQKASNLLTKILITKDIIKPVIFARNNKKIRTFPIWALKKFYNDYSNCLK